MIFSFILFNFYGIYSHFSYVFYFSHPCNMYIHKKIEDIPFFTVTNAIFGHVMECGHLEQYINFWK